MVIVIDFDGTLALGDTSDINSILTSLMVVIYLKNYFIGLITMIVSELGH